MTAPVAPPRPDIPKHRCGAGTQPCGQPARLFLEGWRCQACAPTTRRTNQKGQTP
jgi:hypothetical protein